MQCGWDKQWGQKHKQVHVLQKTAIENRPCCSHAWNWTTVNKWTAEVRDLLIGVTFNEKLQLSLAVPVMCYILFIFFVCIKGTKRLLDPKGLVLVHDNDVLYLLRYAPVSSFSDPPPPSLFKMSSWMVKNPAPTFY